MNGKNIYESKTAAETEILYQRIQPLQNLRTSTCIFKKVRSLQNMFPGISIQRTDSGCEKSKLVRRKIHHDNERSNCRYAYKNP